MDMKSKHMVYREFERESDKLKHHHCMSCRQVRINIHINKKGPFKGCCQHCARNKTDLYYFLKRNCLPVWRKGKRKTVQFQLPECFQDLSYAEKMLIQRVSPFVPLHHVRNGTYGLKGHVVAFEQNIEGFLRRLPRKKNDVTILKVMQTVRAEIGGNGTSLKEFKVRKAKVIEVLEFLKEHSSVYNDIEIDESALDWIEGEEAYLEGGEIEEHIQKACDDDDDDDEDADDNSVDVYEDNGPAPRQVMEPQQNGDNVGVFGYVTEGGVGDISQGDKDITDKLRKAVDKSKNKKHIVIDWPDKSDEPVNEYGNARIFAMAFPWLFPGGEGDIKDFSGDMVEWGKMMCYYEDGRFARDKIFCFFAMNYITRHRNNSSGKYFVDSFHQNCPDTVEELQEQILKGDTSFINNLTYYCRRVKGSSAYWNQKRGEVYSWINYHVQQGHGVPTFFITLSCAEYLWVDIIKLLKDRMEMAGQDSSDCYVGSPKLNKIVNEYSIVVQEYFQQRVEIWLNTVGKKIFGIKYYWCRYEFAPGRGQIHTHLLAITDDHRMYEHAYHLSKLEEDGKQQQANYLAKWAKETFGLTASVGENFDEREVTKEDNPVQIRFTDLHDDDSAIYNDGQDLLKFCQYHDCSGFCLRTHESW